MNDNNREDVKLISVVQAEIDRLVQKYLPKELVPSLGLTDEQWDKLIAGITIFVFDDLVALVKEDPAAKQGADHILENNAAFRAVMHYRFANHFYYCTHMENSFRTRFARKISCEAHVQTKVDIHPGAKIGPEFVLDHGVDTVIGETSEIGKGCYFLQGVVLGANTFGEPAKTVGNRRHPRVGNRVRIGGCARILGPVQIGNNAFIGPHAVVTWSIPDHGKVVVVNQLQVSFGGEIPRIDIYGVVPCGRLKLRIYGKELQHVSSVHVVGEQMKQLDDFSVSINERCDSEILLQLTCNNIAALHCYHEGAGVCLGLTLKTEQCAIWLSDSLALRRVLLNHAKEEVASCSN